jgi:hypothetical protein
VINDDDISHRIIINSTTKEDNSTELVTEFKIIKPENSYTYASKIKALALFPLPFTHG